MRITYDSEADAIYIYLAKDVEAPDTRQIDNDITVDLDAQGRLVGIEVLSASQRLDLAALLPVAVAPADG